MNNLSRFGFLNGSLFSVLLVSCVSLSPFNLATAMEREVEKTDSAPSQTSATEAQCQKCGKGPEAGKSLKWCLGCNKVRYCDKGCQANDWSSHKTDCKKSAPISSSNSRISNSFATMGLFNGPRSTCNVISMSESRNLVLNGKEYSSDAKGLIELEKDSSGINEIVRHQVLYKFGQNLFEKLKLKHSSQDSVDALLGMLVRICRAHPNHFEYWETIENILEIWTNSVGDEVARLEGNFFDVTIQSRSWILSESLAANLIETKEDTQPRKASPVDAQPSEASPAVAQPSEDSPIDGQRNRKQCAQCKEEFHRDLEICGRCQKKSYCSKKCQKLDWKNGHKQDCKPIDDVQTAED